MIRSTEIQMIKLKDLKLNPKNRNNHSKEQIERLAKIIDYQGFRQPLIVSSRTGLVVAGHGRYQAAKKLKLKELPVMVQEFDNDEQEYACMVSDNAIASWAELDLSGINMDMVDLGPDFDLENLGIKDFVLEPAEKFEAQSDEDEVGEPPTEPITRPGDVYQLGRHRLMCGDSTNIQAIDRLMVGVKPDMVFTDPPYGMRLDADYSATMAVGGKKRLIPLKHEKSYENVMGDHDDFSPELINTVFAAFPHCREVFLWGADYYAELLPSRNEGSWIIWDKRCDESADKMFGSAFETCWSKTRHKREIARIKSGLFGVKDDSKNRVHPTQKPVQLAEWFFEKWGKQSDVVADLFGGSGSTLIACEKHQRQCFMLELDPKYCDVIVNRWEKYTGKKAELIDAQQDTNRNA